MARAELACTLLRGVWTAGAVIIAAVFANAALEKLSGDPGALAPFLEFGWPRWLASATAVAEIVGAFALILPGTRAAGGVMLSAIMVGAAATNLANAHPEYLWLNAALLAGSAALAWHGWPRRYRLPSSTDRASEE